MTRRSAQPPHHHETTRPHAILPPLHLDLHSKTVWKGLERLDLRPREFAVLRCLVEHAGEIVTKEMLHDLVWRADNIVVGDASLTSCIYALRQALGEDSKQPHYIETRHKYGYRFVGPFAATPPAAAHTDQQSAEVPQLSEVQALPTPLLVGREAELAQLHHYLAKALQGERQLVFVTGEAGIGKTSLVRAFLRQVAATDTVAIGRGQCIEHFGPGEAYLPVLEALGRLCRAPRGAFLLDWMKQHAPTWLVQMPALLDQTDQEVLQSRVQDSTRARMLREMSEGIEILSQQTPFILVLEDLHWSDASTLNLLASIAQREENARLLILGSYRPEEGLGEGHPLRALTQALRSHTLCQHLALHTLSEAAVAEYVDRRFPASALPELFPQALYRITGGNPFFLGAFIDDLIERGLLTHSDNSWQLYGGLAAVTAAVPENIRQLIGRQIERLPVREQEILEAASVVGMEFPIAVVAAALQASEEEIEKASAKLAARRYFLQPAGFAEWPNGTDSARYRFLHALYQQLWHERIGLARRQHLSQRIAVRIEAAYGDHTDKVAAELAVYFEQGRNVARATHYCARAAEKAIRRCAYQEAVSHLKKGLELLATLPDSPERAQQELPLRITLGISLQAIRGYGNVEVEQAYTSAQKLSRQAHEPEQLFRVLFGLWIFHVVRAEYRTAQELGAQLLDLAETAHDTGLLVEAHGAVGVTLFHLGEIVAALTHLERSTSLYDPEKHRSHVRIYNQDPWVACRSYSGQALWLLGYPAQALQRTQEAWRYAQDLAHPFSQAFALSDMTLIHQLHGEVAAVQEETEALIALSREYNFPMWQLTAMERQAWAQAKQGHADAGLDLMHRAMGMRHNIGAHIRIPYRQARLAELYGKAGQSAQGLTQLQGAFAVVEATEERWWEAEMYRIKGELLLHQRPEGEDARGMPG